jgi:allantoin racemase
VPGLLAEIAAGERVGSDGYVIACFGDPGLDAARELERGPVVGIAEAAMRTRLLPRPRVQRGHDAGPDHRAGPRPGRDLRGVPVPAHRPGLRDRVLELEDPASDSRRVITEEWRRAVVLGCAGMADLAAQIPDAIGVPVIDGVAAATRTVETLVELGLRTGSRGEFAPPPAKPYAGVLRDFQIP